MAAFGGASWLAAVVFLFLSRSRGSYRLFGVGVGLGAHSDSDSEHRQKGEGSNLFHGAVSVKSSSKVGKIPGRTSLNRPVCTYSASKLRK